MLVTANCGGHLFAADTPINNRPLPGDDFLLEKAVSDSRVDVIATALLVRLGHARSSLGRLDYGRAQFKITNLLRGKCDDIVTLRVIVNEIRQETLKEGAEYIVFLYKPLDGNETVGKFLPADKENVNKVTTAIRAGKNIPAAPITPTPKTDTILEPPGPK